MTITNVRVYLRNGSDKLKAFASATVDGALVVNDLKIVDGQNGLFVGMPSRKVAEGKYKDMVFPLTREARAEINEAVIGAYKRAKAGE